MDVTASVLEFSKLISETTKAQRKAILLNITPKQCDYLRQFFFNLLFNSSIQISQTERNYLNHNLASVRALASRRICLGDKKKVLVNKHLMIKRAVKIIVQYLNTKK